MTIDELTHQVIGCAFTVHSQLGPGFLEKVYENALKIELEQAGFAVQQQHPLPVHYRNQIVGDFYADLLVNNQLLIELKSVSRLNKQHEVQLVNYLNASDIENGLLINFGSASLEPKRKFKNPQQPSSAN